MASLIISAGLSLAVNYLFPPKAQDVGKLDDLKLQSSAYGTMIPIGYGAYRFPGIIDWQSDLTPHEHSSGGKGGPKVNTWTYSCSFGVKLTKGPVQAFRRIWFDSQLVYSEVVGELPADTAELPATFYFGVETANADPTYETVVGAGNAPAYRDDAAIVFTDLDVTPWGNRIPNITVEVIQNAGPIPQRVSTFTPTLHPGSGVTGARYDATTRTIVVANYISGTPDAYSQRSYLIDGTPTGTDYDAVIDSTYHIHSVASNADICFATVPGHSTQNAFLVAGIAATLNVPNPWDGGTNNSNTVVNGQMAVFTDTDGNRSLYAVGAAASGAGGIAKYPLGPTGVPAGFNTAQYPFSAADTNNVDFIISDDAFVWAKVDNGSGTNDVYKFDSDLNLVHHWSPADVPPELDRGYCAGIYSGLLVFNGTGATTNDCFVYRINADNTFTFVGQIHQNQGNNIPLGGGYFLCADGVVSVFPPVEPVSLADIVADISSRCQQSAIDVSQLTDLVDGYGITQQTDGRGAISPLQLAYHFDPVESSTVANFVKRGGSSVITIPTSDLAARVSGSQEPPIKTYVRKQEEELPMFLDVTYINGSAAYETGNQSAQRQTVRTVNRVNLQLSINMTDTKGKEVADVNLATTWIERDAFTINIPRKYAYLEPTDVISADGVTMRVVDKDEVAGGVIKLDGVRTHPSVWLAAPAAGSGGGFTPTIPSSVTATTAGVTLLDIPLIDDNDSGPGFYAASDAAATLFKSSDGGVTFNQAATLSAATMGNATTRLGDWAGGNVFDESNSVTVTLTNGTLSSATELAVLNGANEAVLGNEIIQFKNATLVSGSTYMLTGLLRGRRGTEFTTGTRNSTDRFVLLPVTNIAGTFSEINQPRIYKVVPSGGTLASATPITFTNTGVGLRTYSPVLVGGGPDTSGNVVVNWTRRTRIGGAWLNGIDASLGETSEQYVVQIWDSTYTNCARVLTGLTSPACAYTSAQQVTDFGAQQQTIYGTVGEIGALGLGIQTKFAIPGAGGSNTSVISPTNPYNYSPPVTTGCTLPTQNNTITWASPTTQTYLGFSPGTEWVIKFTTPSSFGGTTQATLSGAEYPVDGSQPTNRVAVLSTSPCGTPLSTACSVQGVTITIPCFTPGHNPLPTYYATLQPSTTYYLSITTDAPSTMFVNLVHN